MENTILNNSAEMNASQVRYQLAVEKLKEAEAEYKHHLVGKVDHALRYYGMMVRVMNDNAIITSDKSDYNLYALSISQLERIPIKLYDTQTLDTKNNLIENIKGYELFVNFTKDGDCYVTMSHTEESVATNEFTYMYIWELKQILHEVKQFSYKLDFWMDMFNAHIELNGGVDPVDTNIFSPDGYPRLSDDDSKNYAIIARCLMEIHENGMSNELQEVYGRLFKKEYYKVMNKIAKLHVSQVL